MNLIPKDLIIKGQPPEKVYFRTLTAGDHLEIVKGQKYRGKPKDGEVEIDISANLQASHKRLQLSLVTEDNVRVFPNVNALLGVEGKRIKALLKLAEEVHKDDDEDEGDDAVTPAGND